MTSPCTSDFAIARTPRALLGAAIVCLLALTVARARGEEPSPSTTPSLRGDYRIGAGDILEIAVWKNEQLSRMVTVRPDGMISLPLVNDVEAVGLTPMELREVLVTKLTEYVPSAEVSVIVNRVRSFNISVVGAVSKPGRFTLSSPTTVLEALAMSGGLTEFASRRSIFVLRTDPKASQKKLDFNYNRATSGGDPSDNFPLRPGDVVVVP